MLTYTYPRGGGIPHFVTNLFDPFLPSSSSTSNFSKALPLPSLSKASKPFQRCSSSTVATQTTPSEMDTNNNLALIIAALQLISISDEFSEYLEAQKRLSKKKKSRSQQIFNKYLQFYEIFDLTLNFCL